MYNCHWITLDGVKDSRNGDHLTRWSKVGTSKEKNRNILQFSFDNGENLPPIRQLGIENLNSIYGRNTVISNHAHFSLRQFRSCYFDIRGVKGQLSKIFIKETVNPL